jgi:hypothetical protein
MQPEPRLRALITNNNNKPDSNSHWHHVLLLQRPFSIIYFDYINYLHNYNLNIKSRYLFQLQMVLGMTTTKCCVSVECQPKGISGNINILGMGLSFEPLDWYPCIFSRFWYRPTSHTLSFNRFFWFSWSLPDRSWDIKLKSAMPSSLHII